MRIKCVQAGLAIDADNMFNKGKGAGSAKREVFAKGSSGRGPVAKRKVIMTTGEGLAVLLDG